MPAKFLNGGPGTFEQFKADDDDERENGQRHGQRQPFESPVPEMALPGFRIFNHVRGFVHFLRSLFVGQLKSTGRRAGGKRSSSGSRP
jgi:hypothetical protein